MCEVSHGSQCLVSGYAICAKGIALFFLTNVFRFVSFCFVLFLKERIDHLNEPHHVCFFLPRKTLMTTGPTLQINCRRRWQKMVKCLLFGVHTQKLSICQVDNHLITQDSRAYIYYICKSKKVFVFIVRPERSSKENESSCVQKQPQEHQRNQCTTQDRDETGVCELDS